DDTIAAEPAIKPDAAAHGHGTIRQRAVHYERAFGNERLAGVSVRAIEGQFARACFCQPHRGVERAATAERVLFWEMNPHVPGRERTGKRDGGVVRAGEVEE